MNEYDYVGGRELLRLDGGLYIFEHRRKCREDFFQFIKNCPGGLLVRTFKPSSVRQIDVDNFEVMVDNIKERVILKKSLDYKIRVKEMGNLFDTLKRLEGKNLAA